MEPASSSALSGPGELGAGMTSPSGIAASAAPADAVMEDIGSMSDIAMDVAMTSFPQDQMWTTQV